MKVQLYEIRAAVLIGILKPNETIIQGQSTSNLSAAPFYFNLLMILSCCLVIPENKS